MMMAFTFKFRSIYLWLTAFLLLSVSSLIFAVEQERKLTNADCRVTQKTSSGLKSTAKFSDALLWKVSKAGYFPSYVFGTIHVSDPRITNLPTVVQSALNNSDTFVMEALPTVDAEIALAQLMFYTDGTLLKNYVDDELFHRIASILSTFQLPVAAVALMRPWAAFLIMNYPADNTMPLDLKLLETAMEQGVKTAGLETLTEQITVFSEMSLADQLRLLLDSVCNYNSLTQSIEEMKQFYLDKDLNSLLAANTQQSYADEPLYKDLHQRLLTDRSKLMVDRMQSFLRKGNAFIAVGALHLPGDDGIMENLSQQGYKITAIY